MVINHRTCNQRQPCTHALGNPIPHQNDLWSQPLKPKSSDRHGVFKFFNGFKTYRASIVQNTAFESPRNHVLEGPEWACHILRMDGWCIKRGQEFEIHSVEICASAKQFFSCCLQVGWKGSLSKSIFQPTILDHFAPTNCHNHTERLRPLEFWSVPECKICPCVCREVSRNFQTLEFFLHGCIISNGLNIDSNTPMCCFTWSLYSHSLTIIRFGSCAIKFYEPFHVHMSTLTEADLPSTSVPIFWLWSPLTVASWKTVPVQTFLLALSQWRQFPKNMNSKFFQYITVQCVQILYQCPTERHALTLDLLRHTSTDWSLVFAPPISVCLPGMPAEATAQRRVRKVDTSSWNTAKHGWLRLTLQNMGHPEFNKWWHPWVV